MSFGLDLLGSTKHLEPSQHASNESSSKNAGRNSNEQNDHDSGNQSIAFSYID